MVERIAQHHRKGEDARERVGEVLPRDVGGAAMHRLVERLAPLRPFTAVLNLARWKCVIPDSGERGAAVDPGSMLPAQSAQGYLPTSPVSVITARCAECFAGSG